MATKQELADLAKELDGTTALSVPQTDSVQAIALLTDDDFEMRLAMLKKGRDRITRAQREYMIEDEDFGTIPGTPKPTLLKPGAEKLLQLYGLAARTETRFAAGDGETTPPLTFYADTYIHRGSFDGPILGDGHGTANSWEKRYRREGDKVCPNCGKNAIIKSKAEYGGGWYCWPKKGGCNTRYEADDPAITEQATNATGDLAGQWDLANTLTKMASKRSLVDAALRVTASSGVFSQDLIEETSDAPSVAPSPVSEAPEPVVRYAPNATTTRPEGNWTREEGERPVKVGSEGYTEQQFQQVLDASGGTEVVEIGPSNVEGVERGGHTSGANEAQIAEIRRLATTLGWQSKQLLGYAYALDPLIAPDTEVPQDGRVARGELTAYLEGMDSKSIGALIQALSAEVPQ